MLTAGVWITPLELVCYWLYAQSDKTQVLLTHLHLPPNCLPMRCKILLIMSAGLELCDKNRLDA